MAGTHPVRQQLSGLKLELAVCQSSVLTTCATTLLKGCAKQQRWKVLTKNDT